jgi:hypothetical protein
MEIASWTFEIWDSSITGIMQYSYEQRWLTIIPESSCGNFFFCVITQDCCTFFVRSSVRCVGCRKAHGCLHWFSCWQSCPSARKIASYNVLCFRQTQGSTNLDDDLLWREWTSNEQTRSWGSYCLLLAAHKTNIFVKSCVHTTRDFEGNAHEGHNVHSLTHWMMVLTSH